MTDNPFQPERTTLEDALNPPLDRSDMRVSLVTLTPQQAHEILHLRAYQKQRRINQSHVGMLADTIKAPSTLGTFLRSFRWGHVRQLDRVSRELLARAWAAGAGPGDAPFTIDLDSTICETYGLAKEGARHHSLPRT